MFVGRREFIELEGCGGGYGRAICDSAVVFVVGVGLGVGGSPIEIHRRRLRRRRVRWLETRRGS